MKTCSRRKCSKLSQISHGKGCQYCFKCYRFRRMRDGAKKGNKYQPSWEELEYLFYNTIKDMQCPICEKKMIWHGLLGTRKNVISLQHNNDDTIQFLCQPCNAGHGSSQLGDKYFDIPKNHKYCSVCKNILSINKFNKDRNSKDKHDHICKQCKSKIYYRNKELGEQ